MWILRRKLKRYSFSKSFIRIGIFCIGFLLIVGFLFVQFNNTAHIKQDSTKYMAEVYTKKMELTLEKFIAKTNILETAVLSLDGTISEENFNAIAKHLCDDPVIRSIQYLPNGNSQYCYPQKEYEKNFGKNVLQNMESKEDALLAIHLKQNIICGPYELSDGKKELVIWNPIFSKEEDAKFIGFSSVLLDLDELLELFGLNELKQKGYDYLLTYSEEGKETVVISKSRDNLSVKKYIRVPIFLPDRTWELKVIPNYSWQEWNESIIILISGILITIFCAELLIHIREKQAVLNQFKLKEKILELSLAYSNLSIFTYNFETKQLVFEIDGRIVQNLGKVVENVPESLVDKIIFPETQKEFLEMYQKIEEGNKIASCVAKVKMKNQPYIWEEITLIRVHVKGKEEDTIVGIIKDVTKERENEYRLEREQNYRQAMISESIFWAEAKLKANLIFYHGSSMIEEEHNYDEVLNTRIKKFIHPQDIALVLNTLDRERLYREYYEDGVRKRSIEFRFQDEKNYMWVKMRLYLSQGEEEQDVDLLLAIYNIDKKKREELNLRYQAERDQLTNVYNRTAAEEKINDALSYYEEKRDMTSILFLIDLDNFKPINDKMGHSKGDQVLKDISDTLKNYCGSDAVIGRLGGDEFLVFIQEKMSMDEIHRYTDSMVKHLQHTYVEGEDAITVSASVGAVIAPKTKTNFNELYLKADKALYYVKYNNKNGYKIYGH